MHIGELEVISNTTPAVYSPGKFHWRLVALISGATLSLVRLTIPNRPPLTKPHL